MTAYGGALTLMGLRRATGMAVQGSALHRAVAAANKEAPNDVVKPSSCLSPGISDSPEHCTAPHHPSTPSARRGPLSGERKHAIIHIHNEGMVARQALALAMASRIHNALDTFPSDDGLLLLSRLTDSRTKLGNSVTQHEKLGWRC
jgi:hypothetical protein